MGWSILEIGVWSPSAAENPELTLLLDSRTWGVKGGSLLHTVHEPLKWHLQSWDDHRAHDLLRLKGD